MQLETLMKWETLLEDFYLHPELTMKQFCRTRDLDYSRFRRMVQCVESVEKLEQKKSPELSDLAFFKVVIQEEK